MADPASGRDGVPPEIETHSTDVPFDITHELCSKLSYDKSNYVLVRVPSKREIAKDWLPGDPRIRLGDSQFIESLCVEYFTPRLDRFSKFLWLVGRPDSSHIASLTHQLVRGRRIILTDHPELHLVWIHDRVFIKPLPEYLLSYTFWDHLFRNRSPNATDSHDRVALYRALLGFIRTYCYLIQRKSDFELATHPDHRLISQKLRFSDLIQFLETIKRRIPEASVSLRYKYGELRLSRLNFWSRVLLKHHNFAKVHGQYSEYVAQFYAPLLFVFAVLSVILNAMQVGLSINQRTVSHEYIRMLDRMSEVFVPLSLLIVAVAVAWFVAVVASVIARMIYLGLRTQARKRMRYRSGG